MQTPAISNQININSGSASPNKASDNPAEPFGQVLSREMAARPKADEPPRTNAPKSTRSETKSDTPKQTDAKDGGEAATSTATARSDSTSKPATDKTATDADLEEQDAETSVSAESAELLALVASLTQPAQTDARETKDGVLPDEELPADAQAGTDQPLDPSLATQGLGLIRTTADAAQAGDATPADNALTRAIRGTAAGQDMAARAMRLANDRAENNATNKGVSPDAKEFAAGLAQAADGKPVQENAATQGQAGRTEFGAQQSVSDTTAAKPMPDLQQAGPAPINTGAVSQAQLQQAQAASAHMAADKLAPRVGTPGWDNALGQKVVWMVGADVQSASLTLNPPDLGPLQVVLNVSNSQATANFTAAQPEVRQALEASLPKLREMLGEAGIQLGQANVSAGMPNGQQNAFEQPRQSASHSSGRQNDTAEAPVRVGRTQTISGGQGLVDTFA